jgi:membrane protein YdbS with pleckstrin-like domain
MYELVKARLLWLLKVPHEPLDPMGDVHSLRVFRAAPGYLRYMLVGWLLTQVALLAGLLAADVPLALFGTTSTPAAVLAGVVTVLGLLIFLVQLAVSYFTLRLNYEMRWYKVTDRSLRIRTGVWNVSEMTMTFDNIQNITVTQGPLERFFGISDVRVATAGGGEASAQKKAGHGGPNLHLGVFRGVDNPEEIQDLMLARLRRLRDTGLGDPTDDHSHDGPATVSHGATEDEWTRLLQALRDEAKALHSVCTPGGRRR